MKRMPVLMTLTVLALLQLREVPAEEVRGPGPVCLVYRGADGLEMNTLYWAPKGRMAPGILLLHDLGHNAWVWQDFAQRLHEEGYAVLAVNLRGHPESEVRKGGGRNWMRFELPQFQDMAKDVEAARACLASQREVDPTHLGLVGERFGANLGLAGAVSETLRTAVLLSPAMNERWLKGPESLTAFGERSCLGIASADDPQGAEVLAAFKGAAKGRFDDVLLPTDAGQRDYGAGMLSDSTKKDLTDRIVAFLKETLAPPASAP